MTPEAEVRIRQAVAELADALVAAIEGTGQSGPERLLTVREACALVGGISREHLYQQLGAGRLRSIRVGRRRLIPESAIAELAAGPPEVR